MPPIRSSATSTIADPQTPDAATAAISSASRTAPGASSPTPCCIDRLGVKIGDRLTIDTPDLRTPRPDRRRPRPDRRRLRHRHSDHHLDRRSQRHGILGPASSRNITTRCCSTVRLRRSEGEDPGCLPDAGWQVSSPKDATADLARFFDIFTRFLTIVGLSALHRRRRRCVQRHRRLCHRAAALDRHPQGAWRHQRAASSSTSCPGAAADRLPASSLGLVFGGIITVVACRSSATC